MTPRQLQQLMDVHVDLHDPKSRKREAQVSKNPAADLALLGAMTIG